MHVRRALVAALALTLALAACGGDDDEPTSTEETTTTSAPSETSESTESTTESTESTTTTEADPGDDPEALAVAVNLTDDDFEGVWTAEAPDDSDDDDLNVTDCFVDTDLAGNTVAEADSDSFSQEDGNDVIQVGSTGIVTSGVGVASTILGEATRAAFSDCVLTQFESAFEGQGLTITSANLDYASGVPTAAEQVIALNGAIGIEAPDGSAHQAEIALWLHRQGPVIAGVSVFSLGDTDFAGVVDTANGIVGERLADVVG